MYNVYQDPGNAMNKDETDEGESLKKQKTKRGKERQGGKRRELICRVVV